MLSTIAGSWSLLLGIAFMMLGNGLSGTLLGVRANDAGFETATTGLVMAAYYVGYLLGSLWSPRLVRRVGHIRVFAALASLASAAVLLHHIWVQPTAWGLFRFATGLAFAGLYVVAESWINDRASNDTRGRLLAVYMLVSLGGLGLGQLLLNLGDPRTADLFILSSVLVSVALIPISLTATRAPEFGDQRRMGLKGLYRASPLGVVGCLVVGMTYGALFGMGAVYASQKGLGVDRVSYFMAVVLFGGVLAQWPLGYLSDRLSRRTVILGVTLLAAVCSIATGPVIHAGEWLLLVLMGIYGALSLPLYSICVAYTNDYLDVTERVAGSSTIVQVRGVGAIAGPLLAGLLMSRLGPDGFLWFLAGAHLLLGIFGVYRMTRRSGISIQDQHHYPALDPNAQSVLMSIAARSARENPPAAQAPAAQGSDQRKYRNRRQKNAERGP